MSTILVLGDSPEKVSRCAHQAVASGLRIRLEDLTFDTVSVSTSAELVAAIMARSPLCVLLTERDQAALAQDSLTLCQHFIYTDDRNEESRSNLGPRLFRVIPEGFQLCQRQ